MVYIIPFLPRKRKLTRLALPPTNPRQRALSELRRPRKIPIVTTRGGRRATGREVHTGRWQLPQGGQDLLQEIIVQEGALLQ
jgi:hypothetical protein